MKKNIPDNTKQVTLITEIVKQRITVNTCENDAYKFTENFRDARRASAERTIYTTCAYALLYSQEV